MAEFSNPNQQGGQDSKSLVAMMVVFVAVLFGAEFYHAKMNPQPATPSTPAVSLPQASAQPAAAGPPATAAQPAAAAAQTATPAVPVVQATAETTTVIENSLYRITFSNRGAQVVSWVLKAQPWQRGKADDPNAEFRNEAGKPLDLVNGPAAKLFGYPLSLHTEDGTNLSISSVSRNNRMVTVAVSGNLPAGFNGRSVAIAGVADSSFNGNYVVTQTGPSALTYTQDYGDNAGSTGGTLATVNGTTGETLNQALYVPSATGNLSAPASLAFQYSNGDLQVTKTFSFDSSYVLHADVKVTRVGAPVQAFLSWPSGFGDQNEDYRGGSFTNSQFAANRDGDLQYLAPKKISGGETISGPLDWAGVADPFFAATFLPDSPASATVTTLEGQLDVSKTIKRLGFGSDSAPTKAQLMPIVGAALGSGSGPIQTRIFVGPKAISVLKSVHATNPKITLEPILEFGFWGFIGKYLFLALQFIHAHLVFGWSGGWGWSIVILTIIINVLMLPFRVKTMQSALKMQRIQPQMDAIKERYKKYKVTDPKRNDMNAEIMQLQKDNGVNMFGGCIPSLITFPFLMAFFYMIPKVVELRQAHWYWLPNLQSADPLHILPIVMVVSQFLVQFYTPSPGVDPQQQKMMAFMMPAFSGYICWNYPSGLALYWVIGNLIGIAQQAVMNRTSIGREMREIAQKRARRKGTTIQARK